MSLRGERWSGGKAKYWIRVFYPSPDMLYLQARIMGLYKGQNIIASSHMLPRGDDIR
jgi:hypothetical protein